MRFFGFVVNPEEGGRMAEGGVLGVLTDTVEAPGRWLVLVTGLFAAAVSIGTFAFMSSEKSLLIVRANVLGTVFHEGGHALASVVTGGGVRRIAITSADGGATWSWAPSPLSRALVSVAGYAMPPLAGLGAAALLRHGYAPAVLALTVAVMALVLVLTRDLVTFVAVAALGIAAFVTLRVAPGSLQNAAAYGEAWLLLTSEIGGLAVLVANRVRHGLRDHTDDAAGLAESTSVPAFVWIAGWLVLIGWALQKAVPLLWP
ncbi:M50 family metallopeptidase [Amycolatopsis rhabdoformis]|uniref:M50 family metallopeptidase n=1 Tax=Amycolatopsis rhabdoformis TaxID=1448059 RepID=A0ABZ1IEX4_9PSEU|nr:M50 family metallopeptidase [Amycolatopsis rhabdoformis]WSE32982.1 M50 family metallopeptidase [Amycolatopsis rhabdoformis]